MSTYYGCPECGYRVVSQETGKCPNCDDGVLGDIVDTTPWSVYQPARSELQPRRRPSFYFRVTFNNVGRMHGFNVRAATPAGARRQAIEVCRREGWVILTPEGNRFNRMAPGEPEHSIEVTYFEEIPDENY